MTPLEELEALANPARAEGAAAYHKAKRRYLGVSNPQIDRCVKGWRGSMTVDERITTAAALWDSDVHEARIAAAKLLTPARIKPDDTVVWLEICRWVPALDAWAVADHAMMAGQRRVAADPSRLDEVEGWTRNPNFWVRRAALVVTLPWTKQRYPSSDELAVRERVLGWAASYVDDREWFIQKAIGWWLRDLSKRDPERVKGFLADYGARMKPFAAREASKYLD